MFEYLLLKGVTDSDKQAKKLANLLKDRLVMVNLITYNPTGTRFSATSRKRALKFKEILEKNEITATLRKNFGQDINAACGQFAANTSQSVNDNV
ncbi:MAG: hypothetical protein ACOC4Z_01835 [Patescibacteria group bacterium]